MGLQLETLLMMPEAILHKIARRANANSTSPRPIGWPEFCREVLDANIVVFGVWEDPSERGGVSAMIIKGSDKFSEIINRLDDEPPLWDALVLSAPEEGLAMRKVHAH